MAKIIIGIVVLIIIGGTAFALTRDNSNNSNNSGSNQTSSSQTNQEDENQSSANNELDPNNYTKGADIGDTLDATGQTEVSIDIDDFMFDPTYLKIKKGTKVTWTNKGNVQHDVTSASSSPEGGLDSGLLNNGESYEFTFNETGLYEYFCTPHPIQMKATVLVVDQ